MKLYIVPTPIGNLEDITLRALRILKEVDFILSEDTRTTQKLLKHYEIENRCYAYHIYNEHKQVSRYIDQIRQAAAVALTSDAGTPGISDPGYLLIREAIKEGIEVICLPGATALIPALINSGLPSDQFLFYGFLPHKKGKQSALKKIAESDQTVIFYESPHRLLKTLEMMLPLFEEDRVISISREISKVYEETYRGTVAECLQYFEKKEVKGEIVVVV
ncbi:MAG TPA: 16S rRNA (cytidine(1402)-2'-O)-methyltransferase [Bacteroidales bacterium]|nr:16S rRNA (cytidine(1402)-2'-O)-methyltransferase [Bacteroidales bacterium]HOH21826.1 16S rRNA (cytidine(1402)-2'-O)-methyltransferase [Bacteroidales bacterium]HPB57158.1 16S rRNA (cytidine(1402)-2'-O)-methyltransferase [Bacteroidales bacterium]HPZ02722.1 16S rRNA (cytidine(1402)-2'-O)-methyltransferase [Bacteroidales bacterium]HQB74378.1 16S rRNA (cytidine(1402)-2'-O)-methyltransferase [Bacteroidales bacterium]